MPGTDYGALIRESRVLGSWHLFLFHTFRSHISIEIRTHLSPWWAGWARGDGSRSGANPGVGMRFTP